MVIKRNIFKLWLWKRHCSSSRREWKAHLGLGQLMS
jgi:hypothetical protein